jgi:hypothetical protein
VNLNRMTITEGMGFSVDEAKQILLTHPFVFKQKFEEKLQQNFDQLHREVI